MTYGPIFPPPNVTNPAISAIRATAPKINNQRDIISPLARDGNPSRKITI